MFERLKRLAQSQSLYSRPLSDWSDAELEAENDRLSAITLPSLGFDEWLKHLPDETLRALSHNEIIDLWEQFNEI